MLDTGTPVMWHVSSFIIVKWLSIIEHNLQVGWEVWSWGQGLYA